MSRLKILTALKFLILSAFISIISLSPSMKVTPRSLIITSFHDSQRLIELVLIVLVLLYTIANTNDKTRLTTNKTTQHLIYILVALAVTSSCFAISPRHALIEISLFAGLTNLALFVAYLYRKNNTQLIKHITYVFWAGILLSMVAFYVGYATATVFKTPVVWPAPISGFSSIRFFNQYQLWTLGLITLPLLTFDFKKPQTRYWLHLGLAAWSVLLFFSASRGALLAWIIGILITAAIYKKAAWPFVRLQVTYLITGFFSYKILFQSIPALRGTTIVTGTVMRGTTNDRTELWSQSLNLIHDNPIFGIGPMHFAWYSKISAHPHNSVLQLMAEWGLPAALLILAMTGYGLVCWLKKYNVAYIKTETKLNRNLAIVLFFTIITNAAYSLVDGVIVMPISQVMMFTFIGLMIGFYHNDHIPQVKKASLRMPVLAGIVLITLAWSTLPEIRQAATGSEKHFSTGYMASGPRFWLELK